ncbi:DNA-directed RNA polymerase subunit B'' [Candidatus Woesearchaeota archaeon]|nr:DNA-directed RNA polymerase subunit B'' [Candidatus Woesearchaeota archaeon]
MTKELLVKKYFEEHSFIESNIKSFNKFISREVQQIVNEVGDIVPTIIPPEMQDFKIRFDNITINKPQLIEADGSTKKIFPIEARLRKLTYSAPMQLDVSTYSDGVARESFNAQIGKLPVMLKSKLCHLSELNEEELIKYGEDPTDPGGYFILNGNERVLITVEDLVTNKVFIQKNLTGPSPYTAKLFSQKGSYSIPHLIEQMKDGIIYISFTRFKKIPIIAVIKALGLTTDQEIMNLVCEEGEEYDEVYINLYNSIDLRTVNQAVEFLSKKAGMLQPKEFKEEKTLEQLDLYLLPHIGITPKERLYKAYNLCKVMKKMLRVSKRNVTIPDKDHYKNKKLKLSGDLLADLLRVNMRLLVNDIIYNFQRLVKRGKFQSVRIIIRDKLLSSRIKSAMATGSWVGGRKGISQNIDRINFLATTSHLQRVVSMLSASQENFEARELHPTHWGRLCLKKDTRVLLADKYSHRTLELLQNCWSHHKVSSFDSATKSLRSSSISNYYTSNPKLMGKKVYKLISESGREVTATEDHPFYTENGWTDASKLKAGDKVAVYPALDGTELPQLPTNNLGLAIVSEENLVKNYPNRFKHYIKQLKTNELIPFTINNYKIEIVARLLGHIFSDGHCGKNNLEFYCGTKEDAEAIANDIRLLGFEPSKIMEKHTRIKIGDKIVNYKTFMLSKGGALHALLVCSGAPVGKKTDVNVELPSWVLKASLSAKREFLAALLGGDGPKPRFTKRIDRKSGSKLHIDSLIFHKRADMKENIIKFSQDIKKLFGEFGFVIKNIRLKEDYLRKDGSTMLKCEIIFGKSQKNIKTLLTRIGYRYCIQKEREANYIGEWLRLHDFAVNKRINLKNEAKKLYKGGVKPKKISAILNLNYRVVQGWLFEPSKYENTRLSQNMLLPYDVWLKESKLGASGAVWEKIVCKEVEDLDDVRDFTTAENTHSFIANGFITHNCPIETPEGTPIGLRKNLSMLCQITQDEIPEDRAKKILEGVGLKLK